MPKARNSRYAADYRWILAKLIQLRQEAGISQETVATALGTSQSMMSKLERGVVKIDLADLIAYLDVVHTDPLAFMAEYLREGRSRARQKVIS